MIRQILSDCIVREYKNRCKYTRGFPTSVDHENQKFRGVINKLHMVRNM